ncbi:MAG: hypothetical protein NT129_05015, partial [Candidatus Aenigmarchaeota archaeon]|nr:hypothetical protein [Candidatus Aenigmarchaeota archaeon]
MLKKLVNKIISSTKGMRVEKEKTNRSSVGTSSRLRFSSPKGQEKFRIAFILIISLLSAISLSKLNEPIGIHRHTIVKYIYELTG